MFDLEIDLMGLSPEEATEAIHLKMNIGQLKGCVRTFRSCLQLFQSSRDWLDPSMDRSEKNMLIDWGMVAVQHGALVAYTVDRLMVAINRANIPSFNGRRDQKEKSAANTLFLKEFPSIHAVRLPAAHLAEFSKSREDIERHSVPDGVPLPGTEGLSSFAFFTGSVVEIENGAILTSTVEGKVVSYELSPQKVAALKQVVDHVIQSFYPLEPPPLQEMRRRNELPPGLVEAIRRSQSAPPEGQ